MFDGFLQGLLVARGDHDARTRGHETPSDAEAMPDSRR